MGRLAAFLLLVIFANFTAVAEASAEKRVALVIGNSSYSSVAPLRNPVNDASDIAELLRNDLGFDVRLEMNVDKSVFEQTLAEFTEAASLADVAFVFYAGHGVEVEKHNYLIPVNAELRSDRTIRFQAVTLDDILASVDGAKLKIVVLDACRDNPFAALSRSASRGLARISESRLSEGTLISYSAKEGTAAQDGLGRNSPFATALRKYLPQPGIDLQRIFRNVAADVREATNNKQEPFFYGALPREDVFLKPAAAPEPTKQEVVQRGQDDTLKRLEELSYWGAIKDLNDAGLFRTFLEKFPDGVFAPIARLKIDQIEGAGAAPATADLDRRKKEEEQRLREEEERRVAEETRRREEELARRKKLEEEFRARLAEEARKREEELARQRKADEERRRQAEAELARQRLAIERERERLAEEARRREEEFARQTLAVEAERKRRAEELERQRIAEEAKQQEEELARQRAEDEERQRLAEEARKREEELARKRADDEERQRLAQEARKREQELTRQRLAEEEERQRLAEEARKREQEIARQRAEEEERLRVAEAEKRAKEEELVRQRQAEERKRIEAELARKRAEEEEKLRIAEEKKRQKQLEEARIAAEEAERVRLAEAEKIALAERNVITKETASIREIYPLGVRTRDGDDKSVILLTVGLDSVLSEKSARVGDRILRINGKQVGTGDDLLERLHGLVWNNQALTLDLVRPDDSRYTVKLAFRQLSGNGTAGLGVAIESLGTYVREVEDGLLVTEVQDGSTADEAGFAPGDVIALADGRAIKDVAKLESLVANGKNTQLKLTVLPVSDPDSRDVREVEIARAPAPEEVEAEEEEEDRPQVTPKRKPTREKVRQKQQPKPVVTKPARKQRKADPAPVRRVQKQIRQRRQAAEPRIAPRRSSGGGGAIIMP